MREPINPPSDDHALPVLMLNTAAVPTIDPWQEIIGEVNLTASEERVLRDQWQQQLPALTDPDSAVNLVSVYLHTWEGLRERKYLLHQARFGQILRLFSHSPGLGRFLIRRPSLIKKIFPIVPESVESFRDRLHKSIRIRTLDRQLAWLRQAKTIAYIQIVLADILQLDTLIDTTMKISLVGDASVRWAMSFSGLDRQPVAIIAMGKWGGQELNYSSDIDLLFVAANHLTCEDLDVIQKLATKTIRLLDQLTDDGFVFRVDNRLRPEGASGRLIRTVEEYIHHYRHYAAGWEFQALIKARYAAGERELARQFIAATKPLIYRRETPPEQILLQVREMKKKIEKALVTRHQQHGNVKLGIGGIRDIEFIVQFLQLHHGRGNPNLHETNTLTTIKRLYIHRILSLEEHTVLHEEYVFLRQLEHYLQIAGELPIRQLPGSPRDLEILGRKMGFQSTAELSAGVTLVRRYGEAIHKTRMLFHAIFDATIDFWEKKKNVRELCQGIDSETINAHFQRLESDYFLQFSSAAISEHIHLIDRLARDNLCEVQVLKGDNDTWQVTIVALDYIGEFSKICGLFSAYGLSIVSGGSYTYAAAAQVRSLAALNKAFYRRPDRRRYYDQDELVRRTKREQQKIVCVATVRRLDPLSTKDLVWPEFRNELNVYLELLREQKYEEANERINLRVISSLQRKILDVNTSVIMLPIEFHIDNDSDNRYTILDITSADRFMFLFEFTNVLATRNYYIGKIAIETRDNHIHDRLFLTTRQGRKIVSPARLQDLKTTLTLIKQFAAYLPCAPNPQLALKQFSDFADDFLTPGKKATSLLMHRQDLLENFARILGASKFLWEDFLLIQHRHLLPLMVDASKLDPPPSIPRLSRQLRRSLAQYHDEAGKVDALNRFKDREMFRIDLRHLTRRVEHFTDFSRELAVLADVVMTAAVELAIQSARTKFTCPPAAVWALMALGKWGGQDVGYASDFELMFIWHVAPDAYLETNEFFQMAAQSLLQMVKSRRDGIFELDFRLRPGGKNAELATPLERYLDYFSATGEADTYERQALIRLRPVAGDSSLQRQLMQHRDDYVFGPTPFDLERIRYLRQRQIIELIKPGVVNAKFSPGGLVDAEYFIQVLQIRQGNLAAPLRVSNTLLAAQALHEYEIIDDQAFEKFVAGYRFLRALINGLRIVRGNARDLVIPGPDSPEFQYLLRRLESFAHAPEVTDAWDYIRQQMENIHLLFASL